MQSIIIRYVIFLVLGMNFLSAIAQEFSVTKRLDSLTIRNTTGDGYLQKQSYEWLKNAYEESKEDQFSRNKYLLVYIEKAKRNRDSTRIARALVKLCDDNNQSNGITFCDSLISVGRELNDNGFLAIGYYNKSKYLSEARDFRNSLNSKIEAYKASQAIGHDEFSMIINFSMAQLKTRLGNFDEALEVFKESYIFAIKNNLKEKNHNNYLRYLFELSNAYRRTKIIDSAMYYCELGLEESQHLKKNFYNNFQLTKGILHFDLLEYEMAKRFIKRAKHYYQNNKGNEPNLAFSHFYSAKISFKKDSINRGISELKKVDSIFEQIDDLPPELRETYPLLIKFYEEKNNLREQLYYTSQLIKLDSVLYRDYWYITNTIKNDFDTPKLIAKKEILIKQLFKKDRNSSIVMILIIILFIGAMIYHYYRRMIQNRKFQHIIDGLKEKESKKGVVKTKKRIEIAPDILDNILSDLDIFIQQKGFLESNLNLNTLAKQLQTNSKYLSKVIRDEYDKKYIDFINDLRVDYAIAQLYKDKKLRLMTIKAISEEVGFGHADSFSNAFTKKTGMKPSTFIKKM